MRAAIIALLLLFGCDNRPNQWDAFVYPNANDLTIHERIAGFKSFELCQEAAIDRLRRESDPDAGDYECGYKCERRSEFSGYVCKETRK